MRKFAFAILGTVSVLALNACENSPLRSNGADQLVAEPNVVHLRIADAADRAATALTALAEIEAEKDRDANKMAVPVELTQAPMELRRQITLDWVGPVEPLVKQLADRAGYNYKIMGNRPSAAMVVSVNANSQPLIDVLRNIGLQMGKHGSLIVDSDRQSIEVQYAPDQFRR